MTDVKQAEQAPVGDDEFLIQIAIVVDSTGSMKPYCAMVNEAVKAVTTKFTAVAEAVAEVVGARVRVEWAAVNYTDFYRGQDVPQGTLCAHVLQNFGVGATADAVTTAIKNCKWGGGADYCEDLYSALAQACNLAWKRTAAKATILVLDAPQHGVSLCLPHDALSVLTPEQRRDFDHFETGSPTGGSVEQARIKLLTEVDVEQLFVIWCSERGDVRAALCEPVVRQLLAPPAQGGEPPGGFFALHLEDPLTGVTQSVMSVLCGTLFARLQNSRPFDIPQAQALVRAFGEYFRMGPQGPTQVLSTNVEQIREIFARNVDTAIFKTSLTTRSKQSSLLLPSSLILQRELNSGVFGTVFDGELRSRIDDTDHKAQVAVKAVRVSVEETKDHPGPVPAAHDLAELKALLDVGRSRNNGLVHFHGWTFPSLASTAVIESSRRRRRARELTADERWILLVMHKYDCDLNDVIQAKEGAPVLQDRDLLIVARDIARGLCILHRASRIVQDLKPANVLLTNVDDKWSAVVADFGMVHKLNEDGTVAAGNVGYTPYFCDPEVRAGAARPNWQTDMYSYGRTLHCFLHSEPGIARPLMVDIPRWITELVANCCSRDLASRPTAQSVLRIFAANGV